MRMIHEANDPIGVFDSGLGGLTVVRQIMKALPNERVVYFGDTARVPYGTKSKEAIIRFSKENVALLLRHRVKMVVVACNTASSWALEILQEAYPLPILGVIVPGACKAAQVTKNKRVGVIATQSTVNSQQYRKNILAFDRRIQVFDQACPLFVPLAEEGWFNNPVTAQVAAQYLAPLKKAHVDTLILGCTHYPLLKPVIGKVMGPKVELIDSAEAIVEEIRRLMLAKNLERRERKVAKHIFLVSDQPAHFRKLAVRFLGKEITNVKRCQDV